MQTDQINNAFQAIFPQYVDSLSKTELSPNETLETFIRQELPAKIEWVKSIEQTFVAFQGQYTNLILKRPKPQNLIQSLVSKAAEKMDKYFYQIQTQCDKVDKSSLNEQFAYLNVQGIRNLFRDKLKGISELIKEKYTENTHIDRHVQEEIGRRLYIICEIYHFTKGDSTALASKFRLKEHEVLDSINTNRSPEEISSLLYLDQNLYMTIQDNVSKRCRPFLGKKDFFHSKLKSIESQTESRVPLNISILLHSILSKQRYRMSKEITSSMTKELRNIDSDFEEEMQRECKQIISEVDQLKREFSQLKNNIYYLDIIRGTFGDKYKMELNKLENIYYLSNVEKYLQDLQTFTEKLMQVEERIISNRKTFMKSFGAQIEEKIVNITLEYETKASTAMTIEEIINQEFEALQSSLYGVVPEQKEYKTSKSNTQNDEAKRKRLQEAEIRRQQMQSQKEERQRLRRQQMEEKAEAERQKREMDKIKLEERRKEQEERMKKMKAQKEQRQKLRKAEQEEKDRIRKAEAEEKLAQKRIKDQQDKARLQEELQRKQQQKQQREKQERQRKEKLRKQKEEEQQRKKQQTEVRRKAQQAQLVKKKQAEADKQKQELEKQKRLQEQKAQRQKEEKDRKERQLAQKKQRQERQKQEMQEKAKVQKQAREKEQKQKKQKLQKEKLERQLKQKKDKEEREQKIRKQKSLQDQKRREKQQNDKRIAQEKRQKQQKEKKEKEEREERQRVQLERKKAQELAEAKAKKERQQQQERQRQAKIQKEKEQAERIKREKEQAQKIQKQKRQKQEADRIQRENQQREAAQREKAQKQQKQRRARIAKEEEDKALEALLLDQDQKKPKAPATKPKGGSGFNYDDLGDLEDDLQAIEQKQSQEKAQNEAEDDDYGQDYEDDFESPQKEDQDVSGSRLQQQPTGSEEFDGTQIQPMGLIGPENVKCLNDYLKGTSYARKNKPNLQPFNNPDYYMYVFEEFVESRKLFIFSSSFGNALLDLSKELQNEDALEDDLKVSVETIREELFEEYSSKLGEEEIFPATRLVFPFAFKNEFDIKLIEFLPQTLSFVPVLGKALPEDEQTQNSFNSILEGLLHIFQIEQDPVVQHCVLSEQSAMVLSTFENHLPCLLSLFAMHYEQEFKGQIVIDRFTVDRFFYTAQVLSPFYQQIEQKQEEIINFYDGTMQKYEQNEDLNIVPLQIETTTENYELLMAKNSEQLKDQFLQSKQKTTLIMYQVIMVEGSSEMDEEEEMASMTKFTIYASLERGTAKPQITYFIVSKDSEEQQNSSTVFDMISEGDEGFDVAVYTDFTRHNGLTQYSDWTLPLWARTIQKRKLTPINAFRALTFSMAPYYIAYKDMD